MSTPLRTRRMTAADLPAVMAIENQAFSNPWSTEMVRKELSNDWSTVLLAEEHGPSGWVLRGFAIFWLVYDELHILNVAVDRDARRHGHGRTILREALAHARQHRCRSAILEVRRSNAPAIGLYGALGFRMVGVRPGYYADNKEDAVIMVLDLEPQPSTGLDTPK